MFMTHYHAVVWLDHHEARVFQFNATDADEAHVHPARPHVHLHHHRGSNTDGRSLLDQHFLKDIAKVLVPAGEVLICGPGQAKMEFAKYLEQHEPAIHKKVAGIETVDHPTDPQIVAHARKYFRQADRMKPQIG
jgi:stalled ribosome rescue protein Dom34